MNRLRLMFNLLAISSSITLYAQKVTLQFKQTEYDIKGLHMIDSDLGIAVGESHWDQSLKAYRSTILKTMDGGLTWNRQSVSGSEDLRDVNFPDPDHGWAAGNTGLLLYSDNGGSSWIKKNIGTVLNFKSICFSDSSNGWVVANEEIHYLFEEPDAWKGRVWHTSNGGASWVEQNLPADAGIIHRLYFINNMEGWALGVKNENIDAFVDTRCAAYHTSDGGETWTEKYSPDLDLVFTDIDFPDEDHGFMVGFKSSSGETNGLMFRTSDGGDNWQRSTEENDVLWELEFVDSLRGYTVGADYYSAWGPPVYRTMDGGVSWDKIMMKEHDNQGLYGLSVFENKVMGLGDDGYLIQSLDPWGELPLAHEEQLFTNELIDTLYNFEDVFFITPFKGWAVGQKRVSPYAWGQVIMHTDDGGASWTEQYSMQIDPVWAFAFRLNAVQFISENTGWAVGKVHDFGDSISSGVLFTNDGGKSWSQQALGVSEGQIVDLFFLDDQIGWALTDRNSYPEDYIRLLKTTDGGMNWEMVSTGQEGSVTIGFAIKTGSLLFQDEQTGWILGAQCDLLKTEDGGVTWTRKLLPEDWTNTFDIGFSSDLKGTVCGEANFMTTDGGETWGEGLVEDNTLSDLCFIDSTFGWMVGEWGNIYHTSDGGSSWEKIDQEATAAALKSVSFPDNTSGWAAGRGGIIVHIDPSGLSSAYRPSVTDPSIQLLQNHPNPFSIQTEIRYRMTEPGTASLTVFDMNGRKTTTLVEGFRAKGMYSIVWERKDDQNQTVGPGVYIYRLITKEGSTSKSMVVY